MTQSLAPRAWSREGALSRRSHAALTAGGAGRGGGACRQLAGRRRWKAAVCTGAPVVAWGAQGAGLFAHVLAGLGEWTVQKRTRVAGMMSRLLPEWLVDNEG